MSKSKQFDPDEESFAALLRGGIEQLRNERGPCPSSEDLVAFFEGRLAASDALRVQSHIEACGPCDVVLSRLKKPDFEQNPHATKHKLFRLFWRPALGYSLAAFLAVPAFFGLKPLFDSGRPPVIGLAAPILYLETQRRAGVALGPHTLRLSPDTSSFIVEFFAPMATDQQYVASILDGHGKAVVSTVLVPAGDAHDKAAIICPRLAFPPGDYVLSVIERGTGRRQFEYSFQIQ